MGKPGEDRSKPPSKSKGDSLLDWFFQPSMLVRASLIAGALALWPYFVQKLPSLDKRPEYRLAFRRIQINPAPPQPVPENLVEQVAERSGLSEELSILDEKLTSEVATAFRRHPWVLDVVRVQKSYPAAIAVELEYRRPVAMVQYSGRRIPIDIHGVILPGVDFTAADATRFPTIQNVSTPPASEPGLPWDDPALIAAARLASFLGEHWKTLKFDAIVVPRSTTVEADPNDVRLELVTQDGSKILWGRAPGDDHPGELQSAQKIRRLEKYLADFGDYGKPNGPYEIDIRHWQEISRRPLATQQPESKSAKSPKDEHRLKISEGKKKTRS